MIGTLTWNAHSDTVKPVEEPSDLALVARVSQRDSRALELLYSRYSAAALGLALRILGDRATAEEIVQEAFWRVWKRAKTYRQGRGQFCTWLLSIVHHLAIDEVRRRRVRPVLAEPEPEDEKETDIPDVHTDVAATVFTNIVGEQVRAAVARLPEPQRQVLELAYFQGLTHQEIAARLGEPLGTVHTRTRLALFKLREQLAAMRVVEA